MTITGERLRAGVAGWPVAHSRSPLIHGYWLERLGIEAAYERFPVPPGHFAEFAARIGADRLVGANVTVPHKEAAFSACDRRTPVAEALGAVNVLWREDGRLCGDNTDVAGFLANLDEWAPGWMERRRSAVIVGAGGAARAVAYGLAARGFERVTLINRTQSRAQTLAEAFGGPRPSRRGTGSPSVCRGPIFSSTRPSSAWRASPPWASTSKRCRRKRSWRISSTSRCARR